MARPTVGRARLLRVAGPAPLRHWRHAPVAPHHQRDLLCQPLMRRQRSHLCHAGEPPRSVQPRQRRRDLRRLRRHTVTYLRDSQPRRGALTAALHRKPPLAHRSHRPRRLDGDRWVGLVAGRKRHRSNGNQQDGTVSASHTQHLRGFHIQCKPETTAAFRTQQPANAARNG